MTAILSREEWEMIKISMENLQARLEAQLSFVSIQGDISGKKFYQNKLNIVKHFNSISVDSIEELADKIEKQRRKEKRSEKKETQIHKGYESHSK